MVGVKNKSVKIVLIGAGSATFGRKMIADVLGSEELRKIDCTLVLVDINEKTLEPMYKFANLLKNHYGSSTKIEKTSNRLEALPEANYVILSVARKRWQLWDQDFSMPLTYGFEQVFGECGGPGALFHALRSFELVIPICKDIERICPDSLVINFTNPVSRVMMAINYLTKVNAVGLCHGVFQAHKIISTVLRRPLEELDILSGGINHFYWIVKIADAKTGEDLYPEFKRKVQDNRALLPPLCRKLLEVFGLLTYPVDSHPAEYLSFAYEITGPQKHTFDRAQNQHEAEMRQLEPYLTGEKPIDEKIASGSSEIAVPIINDIEFDRRQLRAAVNVLNKESYVENLPTDAVVEVPAMVDAQGIHPKKIGPLPEAIAAFTRIQVSIQKLLVEAYSNKSKNLLLQALLLDPIVDSCSRAEKLLNDMLKLQSTFLPEFK